MGNTWNRLEFRSSKDLEVTAVQYTVNDFSISSGQNNDGHVYKGFKAQDPENSKKLRFNVGRKGSGDVAHWFNVELIDPTGRTTFAHPAGKLNFAFVGTLELTIYRKVNGLTHHYQFDDIFIAQGHSGATNNWWFGGKNCQYVGTGTVRALSNDKSLALHFLRDHSYYVSEITVDGYNGVDQVDVFYQG